MFFFLLKIILFYYHFKLYLKLNSILIDTNICHIKENSTKDSFSTLELRPLAVRSGNFPINIYNLDYI